MNAEKCHRTRSDLELESGFPMELRERGVLGSSPVRNPSLSRVLGMRKAAIWQCGLSAWFSLACVASPPLLAQGEEEAPAQEAPAPARVAPAQLRRAAIQAPIRRLAPAAVNRQAIAAAVGQAQDQANAEPRGALDDFSTVLTAITDVKLQNDRLVLTPIANYQQFQQALYSNAGAFGGGGTSGSGNGREMITSVNWQRLTGIARIGQQAPAGGELLFSENDHLRRSLQCRWSDDGSLLFSVLSPIEPLYVELRTSPDKPMSLVYFGAGKGVVLRSESFTEILQGIDSETRDTILGTIRKLGLPLPATPYEPAVMQAVKERLAMTADADELTAFRELVKGFDDNSFETREACSAQLTAEFEQWRELITLTMDDESFSLEARSRMREIFREKVPEQEREVMEVAIDLDLESDPLYLVFLLKETAAEEATKIVEKLESLTGSSHGTDVAAWEAELQAAGSETGDATIPPPVFPTGSFEPARLEKLAGKIAGLAHFEILEGALVLDQALWKQGYGDRSIADVNAEIKQTLETYGLPPTLWMGEQLANLGEAAYPVARVMALETDVAALPNAADVFIQSRMNQQVSPNPQFTLNGVMVRLVTQNVPNAQRQAQPNPQAVAEPVRFDFTISELTDRKRELRFGCSQDGASSYVVYREYNAGLLFIVGGDRTNGWSVQVLTEEGGLMDYDANIQTLVDRNSELFANFIGPRLLEIGVQTPWATATAE